MQKRILSLIMAFCIITLTGIVCTITASAAESGTCGNSLSWVLDDEGTLTISGEGDMDDWKSNLYVPWTYLDVKKIVIEEGVESIGNYAFSYCIYAESITISETVTTIGKGAFNQCRSLSEITIPASVRSIDSTTFDGCTGLAKITVSDGNESYMTDEYGILYTKEKDFLYKYPSASANKECVLPARLQYIHKNAFELCENLESIKVEEGGWVYSSDDDGVLYNKNKDTLLMYPLGKKSEKYTIASHVKTIATDAFSYNNKLKSVDFTQGLTTIENSAFAECAGLEKIKLPDSLTTLGSGVFKKCSSLKDVTLPESITSIGDTVFYECTSLENIVIPEGVKSIGINSFYKCGKLKSITLPNSLKEVSQFCFQYCNSLSKVKYYGTAQEWQTSLYIDQGNNPLINASREYAKFTKTTLGPDGKTYIVVIVNVPREKTVIMAFYKDGKLVDYDYDYDAYSDYKVYLKTNKEFDTAKVFVWDDLENLTSLSETEYIYK